MEQLELGRTGMQVSRIGFGAWQAGGTGRDPLVRAQDDEEVVAAIRHAADLGVTWVDTAAAYGHGHSEEVVCRALAEMSPRDRPLVFTKCGQIYETPDSLVPLRVGRPQSIRAEADESLRRLGSDALDLYQMHWPAEDGTPLEEYWGTLLELKQEGKVRAVGLSNHSVDQLNRAEQLGHVESLQPPLSIISRAAAGDVIPWCRKHQTGVIVYSPLKKGLLSGHFSPARAASLREDDWRTGDPEFVGDRLNRNLALVDALREIGVARRCSVAELAVAWTINWPGVTAAIVGARTAKQVDGWVGAASMTLSPTEIEQVAEVAANVGEGPRAPRASV